MSTHSPLLSVCDVSRTFQVRQGLLGAVQAEVRAVNQVSFTVTQSSHGPSGTDDSSACSCVR